MIKRTLENAQALISILQKISTVRYLEIDIITKKRRGPLAVVITGCLSITLQLLLYASITLHSPLQLHILPLHRILLLPHLVRLLFQVHQLLHQRLLLPLHVIPHSGQLMLENVRIIVPT